MLSLYFFNSCSGHTRSSMCNCELHGVNVRCYLPCASCVAADIGNRSSSSPANSHSSCVLRGDAYAHVHTVALTSRTSSRYLAWMNTDVSSSPGLGIMILSLWQCGGAHSSQSPSILLCLIRHESHAALHGHFSLVVAIAASDHKYACTSMQGACHRPARAAVVQVLYEDLGGHVAALQEGQACGD